MIVERIQLAGVDSYLRDGTTIDLASGGTDHRGVSPSLGDGMGLELAALHLLLEADDLESLFAFRSAPLLRVRMQQRLTPDLLHDPFGCRRHSVGGAEDFRRGVTRNMESLDVNGVQALVSLDGETVCAWRSPVYQMPAPGGIELTAAAWSLAASNLVPAEAFTYSLRLRLWLANGDTQQLELCSESTPQDPRAVEALALPGEDSVRRVTAYQVEFSAEVAHDAAMMEREAGSAGSRTRGRPLLTAVHLLEPVPSPYDFRSLRELTAAASSWDLIQRPGESARRMVCTLPLSAHLGEDESVTIEVEGGNFTRVEARLDAMLAIRPPIIDRD